MAKWVSLVKNRWHWFRWVPFRAVYVSKRPPMFTWRSQSENSCIEKNGESPPGYMGFRAIKVNPPEFPVSLFLAMSFWGHEHQNRGVVSL